jgi:molybdopterin synthase sulfur carrier subunit
MQFKFYATLRDLVGGKVVEVPVEGQATIGQVLAHLVALYPALGPQLDHDERVGRQIKVLINGRAMEFLQDLDTPVCPADNISIFPPIGGG